MRLSKYDRLLFILNLLRTRKNLNAERLARECGVTERTIYRDIIALSEAHIPIYYDNGYKYASGNFLPPLNFNIDEYLVLKKVLESSPLLKDDRAEKLIKSIETKIEANLSPSVREQKFFTSETTDIKIKSTVSERFSGKCYSIIEKGIRESRLIDLNYDSIESGVTRREIEPYFLIFIERAFYFVGFCHRRRQLRTFRLDRVIDVSLTDKIFVPRKDIDPAEYFENSWGVFSGKPTEVEIIFKGKAARVIKSGCHHKNEKISILDEERIRYELVVDGIEEISRWLIGFGGDAEVVKPISLAQQIKRMARDILKIA